MKSKIESSKINEKLNPYKVRKEDLERKVLELSIARAVEDTKQTIIHLDRRKDTELIHAIINSYNNNLKRFLKSKTFNVVEKEQPYKSKRIVIEPSQQPPLTNEEFGEIFKNRKY